MLKTITYWKGNGYVAFYNDINIIKDMAKPRCSEFVAEWVTTEPGEAVTTIHEWQAFVRYTKTITQTIKVTPGDYFTCEEGKNLLWAFVYSTPEAVEAFNLENTTQAFKVYDNTENMFVQCNLKGPDLLTEEEL